ncbi:MAG: zinc-finger domain-containing protein [Dongiaceae bacterium]
MSAGTVIDPPEIVEADSNVVACDGNDAALGHPRVFLNIGAEGFIDCPYCDRRFKLRAGALAAPGH